MLATTTKPRKKRCPNGSKRVAGACVKKISAGDIDALKLARDIRWAMGERPSLARVIHEDGNVLERRVTQTEWKTKIPGMKTGDVVKFPVTPRVPPFYVKIEAPTLRGFFEAVHKGVRMYIRAEKIKKKFKVHDFYFGGDIWKEDDGWEFSWGT
jgi:hypothetical protein